MNAEVLQAHPSILSSVSEHLYGFLDGFVNTRYTCILVDIHSTGTREKINIKHIYIVRDCTLYTVEATSALACDLLLLRLLVHVHVHVLMRDERRNKERSKQGQTNNKAKHIYFVSV